MAMPSAEVNAKHSLADVRHIILVLSGKGGVGKSTVACQLALSLAHQYNKKVGLLDVDLCGPSVPKICGLEGRDVMRDAQGWRPITMTPARITVDGNTHAPQELEDPPSGGTLKVMSIAYLLPSDKDAVVWRGPKKDAMIKQFIQDVNWGQLDFLIVDTPPGTSDEHLTLCEILKPHNPTGAVVVTTPQEVSTDDVKKELSFCFKLGLRCLGIVENMSGFVCPHCTHCTDIFSKGGGKRLSDLYEVAFLGSIPIDPNLSLAEDQGKAFICDTDTSEASATPLYSSKTIRAVREMVAHILEQVKRVEQK